MHIRCNTDAIYASQLAITQILNRGRMNYFLKPECLNLYVSSNDKIILINLLLLRNFPEVLRKNHKVNYYSCSGLCLAMSSYRKIYIYL
jgi:hypothetical protein